MKKFEVDDKNLKRIGDYLREIRENRGYSMYHVETYTGIQRSELKKIEEAKKKKINPLYLKELAKIYNIDSIKLFEMAGYYEGLKLKNVKSQVLKVYKVKTSGNGVLYDEHEEVFTMPIDFVLTEDTFAIAIEDDELEPKILNEDKVVVEKILFDDWKEIDGKLVVIEYSGKKILRTLKFMDGEPVFLSLTGYEKNIPVNEKIKYLGIVTRLIDRKI